MQPKIITMKLRLFMLILLLSCFSPYLLSQDYSILKSGKNLIFDDGSTVMAISADSVKIVDSDTIYYHFLLNRNHPYNITGCNDLYGASLYGKKNIHTINDRFVFFNSNNDTISIIPNSEIGEKWIFYRWLNQDLFIEASMTNISNQVVLDSVDEVKTITLLVKNSLNQNFTNHPLNLKVLYLSKNYGLLNPFDFYKFPEVGSQFTLKEIYNASDRISVIHKRIFNFNIGDEFHTQNQDANWISDMGSNPRINSGFKNNVITKVIEKNTTQPDISITYVYEQCKMTINFTNSIPDTTYVHDTISQTIVYNQVIDSILTQLPWQTFPTSSFVYNYLILEQFHNNQYNSRINYRYESRIELAYLDTCWQYYHADPQPGYTFYIEGCGGLFYRHELGMYPVNIKENKLLYYKKGNEEWGNPLAPSCMSLISNIENNNFINSKISIYPTPCSNSVFIDFLNFDDTQGSVELYSLDGKLQWKEKIKTNSLAEVSTSPLKNGVYILKFISKNHITCSKIVVSK